MPLSANADVTTILTFGVWRKVLVRAAVFVVGLELAAAVNVRFRAMGTDVRAPSVLVVDVECFGTGTRRYGRISQPTH